MHARRATRVSRSFGAIAALVVTISAVVPERGLAQARRQAPPAVAEARGSTPLPPPRPIFPGDPEPIPTPAAEGANPSPPPRPTDLDAAKASPPMREPSVAEQATEAEDALCLGRLKELGVQVEALAALAEGACGASRPLKVSRLTDDVAVDPPATMVCAMAEALAAWNRAAVVPEAKRLMSARVKAVAIGTSYQCRTRNHIPGAKLSEHAFANAVDVSGIEFHDHAAVTIGKPAADTAEGRYAAAIQAGACASFHTVLGPGSDVEHGNHLHLDLRGRRNGYRICQ